MPCSKTNICDLIHTSSRHSLKLTSNCTALFSYDSNLLKSVDIFQVAFSDPFEVLWMDLGAGLDVLVNIKTDGVFMDDSDREDFVVKLGVALRDPEFWAQLDLQASLTLPESNGTVSGTPQSFSLRLLHFAGEVASKTEEAPTSSARPPNGVPRATLDEIQITFSLAKTVAESSRKRLKPPLQDSDTLLHTDEDCILEEASFSQPDLRLPSIEWEEETHKLKSSSQSSATDIADMLDEDGALSLQSREHECYVASRVDGNSQSTPQQNHLGKGKRNMSDNTLSSSHISTSHRLIHTAINKMICGKRIRTPPGIKAVAVTPGPKLADVAPAIFSPGYRKAMSERSRLIPAISNSLVSICCHARTDLLRSAVMDHLKTTIFLGLDDRNCPIKMSQMSRTEVAAIIEARLWGMAQRGLYDPLAACRLKPVRLIADEDLLHLGQNEMLERASTPRTLVKDSASLDSPWLGLLSSDDGDNEKERLQKLLDEDALLDDIDVNEIFGKYEDAEELEEHSLYTFL